MVLRAPHLRRPVRHQRGHELRPVRPLDGGAVLTRQRRQRLRPVQARQVYQLQQLHLVTLRAGLDAKIQPLPRHQLAHHGLHRQQLTLPPLL